ncbi:hypothetical protein D3C79_1047130 [compost metagenome]
MAAALPVQGLLIECVQACGICAVQAQGRAGSVFVQVKLTECGHYRLDATIGQGDAQRWGV